MATCNANHDGAFATSRESDSWIDQSHETVADFLGASDSGEVIFGANMTSLTFHFSRAISQEWNPGDEIVVTQLDHDANVRPWVLAARDRGVNVHFVPVNTKDCTLDLDALGSFLSSRTRLVAVGCASNSVGTINPVKEIARMAHEVGALVFLDAVHNAPHALIDVQAWDCDFLVCSAYKFFGPHVGILWGRRHLLESISPYKLNPSPNDLPGRWMTGTQNFECIVGVKAAIEYLSDIGRCLIDRGNTSPSALHFPDGLSDEIVPEWVFRENEVFPLGFSQNQIELAISNVNDSEKISRLEFVLNRKVEVKPVHEEEIRRALDHRYGPIRRTCLSRAYESIWNYESSLCWQLIDGLSKIEGVTIPGITDSTRAKERMPTLSFYHNRVSPEAIADALDQSGIYAWHGNYYAWELSHALGREPDGMVRLGIAHYNTAEEIDRTVEALKSILGHC